MALNDLIHPEYADPDEVWDRIKSIAPQMSCGNFMQGSFESKKDRYVLWNFDNILRDRSGTVGFRGGRGLKGTMRTKSRIAFVMAFIHMCINQVSTIHVPYIERCNFGRLTHVTFLFIGLGQ